MLAARFNVLAVPGLDPADSKILKTHAIKLTFVRTSLTNLSLSLVAYRQVDLFIKSPVKIHTNEI